jgi:hypothetical protein
MFAAVARPVRSVLLFSLELAVLFGIVPWFVSAISLVAAVLIRIGLLSPVTMVIATLMLARGKAVRHARR